MSTADFSATAKNSLQNTQRTIWQITHYQMQSILWTRWNAATWNKNSSRWAFFAPNECKAGAAKIRWVSQCVHIFKHTTDATGEKQSHSAVSYTHKWNGLLIFQRQYTGLNRIWVWDYALIIETKRVWTYSDQK